MCRRTIHTLKLLPWAAMEAVVVLLTVRIRRNLSERVHGQECNTLELTCKLGATLATLIVLLVGGSSFIHR